MKTTKPEVGQPGNGRSIIAEALNDPNVIQEMDKLKTMYEDGKLNVQSLIEQAVIIGITRTGGN